MATHRTDSELIAAYRSGEEAAFDELYTKYVQGVYAFCYHRTMDKALAEDITSDVLVKAFTKLDSYNPKKGALSTWVYRIARNAIIDHYRSFKATSDIETVWDLSADEDPVADTSRTMLIQDVRSALQKLPQEKRDLIVLRLWDGFSYKEIADMTGKTESACKMMFSRTLQELKPHLSPAAMALLLYLPHLPHE